MKRVTEMLLADRQTAHENKQAGAAVSATMGVAKVNGLLNRAACIPIAPRCPARLPARAMPCGKAHATATISPQKTGA